MLYPAALVSAGGASRGPHLCSIVLFSCLPKWPSILFTSRRLSQGNVVSGRTHGEIWLQLPLGNQLMKLWTFEFAQRQKHMMAPQKASQIGPEKKSRHSFNKFQNDFLEMSYLRKNQEKIQQIC